jgi:polyferredoxin
VAQVLILALWAGFLAEKMSDPATQPAWRLRLWVVFGAAFFAQAGLSLAGLDVFSMAGTGELHVPVPAVILAGPLYRGEGLFMPALLAATVLLAGPAWCSHLCYLGAFDQLVASRRRRPGALPRFARPLRIGLALAVALVALGLRLLGAPAWLAAASGLGFGLAGVGVMLLVSRRTGTMVHCAVICPIGLVTSLLSKLSPWRLRLGPACTGCGACSAACRTGALEPEDIERRRPGSTCTLCGDCVGACPDSRILYRLGPLSGDRARAVFVALVAALHAIFLALARA